MTQTNSGEKVYRILTLNPGSNSTKVAIFENEQKIDQFAIQHSPEIIAKFSSAVFDQYDYRLECIEKGLREKNIDLREFDAVAGRGGFFTTAAKSGTYLVTNEMVEALKHPTSEHIANIGGILAKHFGDSVGIPAYIIDPVCVDEMQDVARLSGFDGIERLPKWQPLSHKATARKLAKELGKDYASLNLITAHLGGGITIAAHRRGQVVDVNNGLDGDGPFSADRPGQVPIRELISYCFDKGLTKEEVVKTFISKGGLYSYFGTVDAQKIEEMADNGDEKANLVLSAMAYAIAKEIGSDAAVLEGEVDAIALTGGIAYSKFVTSRITKYVKFIAPLYIYPGESEMEALAMGALRNLRGEEQALIYKGKGEIA